MPTRSSTSTARLSAAFLDTPRWRRTASEICLPMVMVGLSDVMGSWKTIAMSLPRTWRISASLTLARSWPPKRISPPAMWPPRGKRRMIDRPVIVFPQPDSPTSPTVSPGATWKLMPSTAWTVALRSLISVLRSLTSSSCSTRRLPLLQAHVEGVLQGVSDEVEGDDDEHDQPERRVHLPPVAVGDEGGAVGEHRAPGRGGGGSPKPRYCRTASMRMALATWKVTVTTMVPIVFGMMCRTMIRPERPPMVRTA